MPRHKVTLSLLSYAPETLLMQTAATLKERKNESSRGAALGKNFSLKCSRERESVSSSPSAVAEGGCLNKRIMPAMTTSSIAMRTRMAGREGRWNFPDRQIDRQSLALSLMMITICSHLFLAGMSPSAGWSTSSAGSNVTARARARRKGNGCEEYSKWKREGGREERTRWDFSPESACNSG